MESKLILSAHKVSQFPQLEPPLPELAVLGRSNCGKSTLINALTENSKLARASATPGRTQAINFFLVTISQGQELVLVDFPGYGYARAGQEIQGAWDRLIEGYIARRIPWRFLFLLDIRRDLEDFEFEFLQRLQVRSTIDIVLTKADKVSRGEQEKRRKALTELCATLRLPVNIWVVGAGSPKKLGVKELRESLLGAPKLRLD